MASLQKKANSWYCQFCYLGKRHTFAVGQVADDEAQNKSRQVDYLLMRLKQRLITIPPGVDIVTFVENDGNPPKIGDVLVTRKSHTLGQLRDRYLETFANGTIEPTTLYTCRIHFKHFVRILGEGLKLPELTAEKLQEYVNSRSQNRKKDGVGAITIKKEIATLRAAWNWGEAMSLTQSRFPNKGLRYPKKREKPPFMTREEIERKIVAGESGLWECLYLRIAEIEELLGIVQANAVQPFIYPMFAMAAYTGARRSELLNSQRGDFDLSNGTVVIREKKRVRGEYSTRRVPISPKFAEIMRDWFAVHPGGPHTFAKPKNQRNGSRKPSGVPLTRNEAHDYFQKTLAGTKWEVMRGYHVLRHSFVSALANRGVDQRIIDEFVGHQSEQQRKRYRHLYPATLKDAITSTFG